MTKWELAALVHVCGPSLTVITEDASLWTYENLYSPYNGRNNNSNVRSRCGPGNAHFIFIRQKSLFATCRFSV